MRNSFVLLVFFVCNLLIKTILSDDIANNLENNQSLNGNNQQVQSELTETAKSWPNKIIKSVLNNSSKQFVVSPLKTLNTSQTAIYKYEEETNEHVNNSLNLIGINFDIVRTFWNFIEGRFIQSLQIKLNYYLAINDNSSFSQILKIPFTKITQVWLKVVTRRKIRKRNGISSKNT